MKETYNVTDLLIGKLVTITNGWQGIAQVSEEGPYIFVKKENGLYEEVFTENEYEQYNKEENNSVNFPSTSTGGRQYKLSTNLRKNKFGKTYVHGTSDTILNYLTEEEKEQLNSQEKVHFSISKTRVLQIYSTMLQQNALKEEQLKVMEQEVEKNYQKTKRK